MDRQSKKSSEMQKDTSSNKTKRTSLDMSPEAKARRDERTRKISGVGERIAKELWPNDPQE